MVPRVVAGLVPGETPGTTPGTGMLPEPAAPLARNLCAAGTHGNTPGIRLGECSPELSALSPILGLLCVLGGC